MREPNEKEILKKINSTRDKISSIEKELDLLAKRSAAIEKKIPSQTADLKEQEASIGLKDEVSLDELQSKIHALETILQERENLKKTKDVSQNNKTRRKSFLTREKSETKTRSSPKSVAAEIESLNASFVKTIEELNADIEHLKRTREKDLKELNEKLKTTTAELTRQNKKLVGQKTTEQEITDSLTDLETEKRNVELAESSRNFFMRAILFVYRIVFSIPNPITTLDTQINNKKSELAAKKDSITSTQEKIQKLEQQEKAILAEKTSRKKDIEAEIKAKEEQKGSPEIMAESTKYTQEPTEVIKSRADKLKKLLAVKTELTQSSQELNEVKRQQVKLIRKRFKLVDEERSQKEELGRVKQGATRGDVKHQSNLKSTSAFFSPEFNRSTHGQFLINSKNYLKIMRAVNILKKEIEDLRPIKGSLSKHEQERYETISKLSGDINLYNINEEIGRPNPPELQERIQTGLEQLITSNIEHENDEILQHLKDLQLSTSPSKSINPSLRGK